MLIVPDYYKWYALFRVWCKPVNQSSETFRRQHLVQRRQHHHAIEYSSPCLRPCPHGRIVLHESCLEQRGPQLEENNARCSIGTSREQKGFTFQMRWIGHESKLDHRVRCSIQAFDTSTQMVFHIARALGKHSKLNVGQSAGEKRIETKHDEMLR